ncbi:MAG: tetratricopeptide repeat protein, partial [Vicinamibacterales bacterium]
KQRYQDVLRRDPTAAVAANNLAWMMAQGNENIDVALQLAQTAKAKLPLLPEVSDTLGWIYYKKEMPPQAIAALKDSVDRSPRSSLFHYHLGLAYLQGGDREKAKASFEQAVRLGADSPIAADARKQLNTL